MNVNYKRIVSPEEIEDSLEKDDRTLKKLLRRAHPVDIADVLNTVSIDDKIRIFSLLNSEKAADVIIEVDSLTRKRILSHLKREKLTRVITKLKSDDATDIVMSLPKRLVRQILKEIPLRFASTLKKLSKYHSETAGGLMEVESLSAREDESVGDIIQRVRHTRGNVEDFYNLFVVDNDGKLIGVVPFGSLLSAKPGDKIGDIMEKEFFSVEASVDREEVANMFRKYDLVSMPVVNSKGHLMGRITVDDVLNVIEQENTEDIYHMAGIDKNESLSTPFRAKIKNRLPWLLINLITAFLAASVVGLFKNTIQAFVMLAVFMPIVAGMGGNAGTQTLTVTVRELALGRISKMYFKRVFTREILTGVFNGTVTGLLTGLIAWKWASQPIIGIVIFMAMVINMFVASLTGITIPIILRLLKIDPAVASGVIVTTFTDVSGFFSFLGLATLFIKLFGIA